MTEKKFRFDNKIFWLGVVLLTAVRLGIVRFQQAYIWVGGAPLDDELMFRAAQSVTAGQWLGAYDYLTLSKAMFYPVWLALLHGLHLSALVGGVLLWCAASLAAAKAFAPLAKTLEKQLALYAVLAFLPSSWAAYTLRIYRDNIFPALCLLFFAGFAGAALRAVLQPKKAIWPWLLCAGAGLACAYLSREDAGLFLLPFAAVATGILLLVVPGLRKLALVLPYAVLCLGIAAFTAMNQQFYGWSGLSDFSEGSFADAMGAMMRVQTADDHPLLSVPADARAAIMKAVPESAPVLEHLDSDAQMINDFRDPTCEDYRAGSFYWAVRRAAQFEGVYETPQTADAYWTMLAEKINAACDAGVLPSRSGRRSATNQPIRPQYIAPTLAETARGFVHVLTFRDCQPYEKLRSIGTPEDFAQWSGYLRCPFNYAAEAGKDTPYYSPYQKTAFSILQAVTGLYTALLVLGFAGAVFCEFRRLPAVFASRKAETIVPWLLLFGLLGMALLRCAMIAFVEVSSFGIGTSTMYLATVHPLLMLYAFFGAPWVRWLPKGPANTPKEVPHD